jgi:hypothetical protein
MNQKTETIQMGLATQSGTNQVAYEKQVAYARDYAQHKAEG